MFETFLPKMHFSKFRGLWLESLLKRDILGWGEGMWGNSYDVLETIFDDAFRLLLENLVRNFLFGGRGSNKLTLTRDL